MAEERRGETNAYSHKYQQLPLLPKDDFLAQHPEHIDADENALMVARIGHEHAEREALEQARQGLLKKKQGLIADNKKRKEDLANLDKDLETFIDVGTLPDTLTDGVMKGRSLTIDRRRNLSRRLLRRSTES